MRSLVLVGFLLALAPAASAQEAAIGGTGKALVGKWTGKWLSDGRSRASGEMQMEIAADADRVTGQVMFTTSATPPCSHEWQKFAGSTDGVKVSAQVDLKGRCGKLDMVFWIDPEAKGVLTGTYSGEYPDKGRIHLTRQEESRNRSGFLFEGAEGKRSRYFGFIHFLGWWSLSTFIVGAIFGGRVFWSAVQSGRIGREE